MTNFMLFLGQENQFGWESFHSEHMTLSEAILAARHHVKADESWQIVFRNQIIANRAEGFPGRSINEMRENTKDVNKIIASLSFVAILKPVRIT